MRSADEIFDTIKKLKGLETDTALAELLGTKPSTVATWRSRGTIPYDDIVSFCERENVPMGWLLAGQLVTKDLEIDGKKVLTVSNESGIYKQAFIIENGEIKKVSESPAQFNESEFVFVPQFRSPISAGASLLPDEGFEMCVAFRRDWIQRKGDPKNMSLIKVSGDSMEDTLLDGDLILINHSKNYPDPQGGLYEITIGNFTMIKRIELIAHTKKLKIISDNEKYSPLEVDLDHVRINGKVIWYGREIER